MIGRLCGRILAALIAVATAPVGWWDGWQTRHPGDPWDTE